ncbi:MAG: hypothetical protein VW268_02540 [Rhodospirillaceae bacterium]
MSGFFGFFADERLCAGDLIAAFPLGAVERFVGTAQRAFDDAVIHIGLGDADGNGDGDRPDDGLDRRV